MGESKRFFFEKKHHIAPGPGERVGVFQPRPGLGDLVWHLPVIRAIAGDAAVTLITKRSTQADALLAHDPAIAEIVWFDRNPREGKGRHDGPLGFPRLVATLRACRLDSCILLHHGASLAAAMALAGIRLRGGYGYAGAQRAWLNRGPYLSGDVQFAEAFLQADAYARAAGLGDLPEPAIRVDPAAEIRLADMQRPWTVLGIGCHGANRQWGADRFALLAEALLARGPGSVVLLAGADESGLADAILARVANPRVRPAIGWALRDAVALLAAADRFIGNDSGPLNLRAATGRPAYGLFGASGPLPHSRQIRPIIPPGGPRSGMAAITVAAVLDALDP